jgi:hypothetical protein
MPATSEADHTGVLALRNLASLGYAQGFTLWHYHGRGLPLARMTVPGFFDPATGHIRRGDIIFLSGTDGTGLVVVGGPGQGANFTTSPIQTIAAAEPQENACPTIPSLPRPAPLPLLRRLRAWADPRCWSR